MLHFTSAVRSLRACSAIFLACSLLAAACGGGGAERAAPEEPATPLRTEVGTPDGEATSATIGSTGGSLESADGALLVEVPPGALSRDETFSIQPITNHAPGAIGTAYRLLPEGVAFAQPVRVTFRYAEDDVRGTVPSLLRFASQDGEGYWRATEPVALDESSGTVAADVNHFSDWSLVAGVLLEPRSATVKVGQPLEFAVVICEIIPDEDTLLAPLVAECRSTELFSRVVRGWAVNGVPGGDGTAGTIARREDGTALYTAPAAIPASNPVAISAGYTGVSDGHSVMLVANVLIEDDGCSTGSFEPCLYDLVKFAGQALPYDDLPREEWENKETVTKGRLSLDDFDGDGDGTWSIQYTWIEERTSGNLEHTVQYAGEHEPLGEGATLFRTLDGTTFEGRIEARSVQVSGFPFSSENATLDVAMEFAR
jgi:hypothetical protein